MNRFQLKAHILERASLRYTPAGLPALDLVLNHASEQFDNGVKRQVNLQIRAICFGHLAEVLNTSDMSIKADFSGFITPSKTGRGLLFHIQVFNPI